MVGTCREFDKKSYENKIVTNMRRGWTKKTWEETVKHDMKKEALLLTMVMTDKNGGIAADI